MVFAVAVNRVVSESVEKVGAEDLIVFWVVVSSHQKDAPGT